MQSDRLQSEPEVVSGVRIRIQTTSEIRSLARQQSECNTPYIHVSKVLSAHSPVTLMFRCKCSMLLLSPEQDLLLKFILTSHPNPNQPIENYLDFTRPVLRGQYNSVLAIMASLQGFKAAEEISMLSKQKMTRSREDVFDASQFKLAVDQDVSSKTIEKLQAEFRHDMAGGEEGAPVC
jgi:hypothetical protein